MHRTQVQAANLASERIGRHCAEGDAELGAFDDHEQAADDRERDGENGEVVGGDADRAQAEAEARHGQVEIDDVGAENELHRALQDQPDAETCDRRGEIGLEDDRRDQHVAYHGNRAGDAERQRHRAAPGQAEQAAAGEAVDHEGAETGEIAMREIDDARGS